MSSSRFVSSGAIDASTGNRVPLEQKHDKEEEIAVNDAQSQDSTKRQQLVISGVDSSKQTPQQRTNQERWETVQKEIEEERKKKEETRLREAEGAQQSLYEVLQANKAAKQAAFEEQNKIKNQFRALDDDEIRFLDDVRASKRAEEERIRRETQEGLRAFRQAQQRIMAESTKSGDVKEHDGWEMVGRKRKREKERMKGVVRRKTENSESGGGKSTEETAKVKGYEGQQHDETEGMAKTSPTSAPTKAKMALVDYGSDSDE